MDYGEVITRSARLVWKHKILWLFGLLAGLGGSSGSNPLSYTVNAADFTSGIFDFPQPAQRFYFGLEDFFRQTPGWIFILLAVLAFGLGLVFLLISIFGKIGLVRGAWQADGGTDHLGFGQLVNESVPSFWRVVGLTLLVGLPGFAVALIFAMVFVFGLLASFTQDAPQIAVVLLCVGLPLTCLMVPFFWFLGIWGELSTVAVVGEGRGIIDSLKRSWQMIRRNIGPVLLVAVLVLVAQIGFGLLVGLVVAPIGIGALLGDLVLSGGRLSFGFFLPLLLVAIPLSLVLGALFQSYIGTLWTLVFRRLAAAEAAQPQTAVPPVYPTVPPAGEPPDL